MTGRDLDDVPEGMRADDMLKIFTNTLLRTQASGEPDRVTVGSDSFEVVNVETWNAFGTTHYRCLARKVGA